LVVSQKYWFILTNRNAKDTVFTANQKQNQSQSRLDFPALAISEQTDFPALSIGSMFSRVRE